MLREKITKDRLESFFKSYKYLLSLEQDIEGFKRNYNFLKANNYTSDKVMSGSKKASEEEMYVQTIERKSKEYNALKLRLDEEKSIIESQIKRVTNPTYQKILTRRYLLLEDWNTITFDLYGGKDDWHIWGNTKYELLTMNLHRRARKQLEEVSQTAYIPQQQTIEGI